MLFYLTDSLIVNIGSPQYPAIRKAVRYIAMAVAESKHLLRGDYGILEYMKDEFKDDEEIYPVFYQLVKNYTTNTIPNDIYRYIEVVKDGYSNVEKNGHLVKQMEYSYFNDSMKVQAMTVVTEDEDDCALLSYILGWYLSINHMPYNFSFTPQGGGGSRTDVAVRSCLKSGKMVTCVTDSDQRFEGQKLDPRSCGVVCSKIKAPEGVYCFLRLPVHEIENLIPLNHFDVLDWSAEQNKKDKEAFDKLCYNAKSEIVLRFFDIKEGIKKAHIEQFGGGLLNFAAMCCFCNPDIMEGKDFHQYIADLDSKANVYPRLRKRPMAELAPKYREGNMPDPELMSFQFDAWIEIGALLLDTTCARNKEAIMP